MLQRGKAIRTLREAVEFESTNDFQKYCFSEMVRVDVRLLGVIESFAKEVERQWVSVTNLKNVAEKERKILGK